MTSSSSEAPTTAIEQTARWVAPTIVPAQGPLTTEKIEAIRKNAYEEGFAEGLDDGRRRGGLALDQLLVDIDRILGDLTEPLKILDHEVEIALAELAVSVAGQVIRRELRTEPEQVVDIVRQALAILPISKRAIEIRLHPDDLDTVRSAYDKTDRELTWQLIEDPTLSQGDVVVSAGSAVVDGRLDERLRRVFEAFVESTGDGSGPGDLVPDSPRDE